MKNPEIYRVLADYLAAEVKPVRVRLTVEVDLVGYGHDNVNDPRQALYLNFRDVKEHMFLKPGVLMVQADNIKSMEII